MAQPPRIEKLARTPMPKTKAQSQGQQHRLLPWHINGFMIVCSYSDLLGVMPASSRLAAWLTVRG